MTKPLRKQRDRFGRFSLVLNIVTTILVVFSGWLVWRDLGRLEKYGEMMEPGSFGERAYLAAGGRLYILILVLLATLFVHIAIRTVSYIWIGRFWR